MVSEEREIEKKRKKDLIHNQINMKTFRENMSITKLVFLEVMTVLCFLVLRVVIAQNVENEIAKTILQMFEFAVTSIISFYF